MGGTILIIVFVVFGIIMVVGFFANKKTANLKQIEIEKLSEKGIFISEQYSTSQGIIGFDRNRNLIILIHTPLTGSQTFEIEIKDIISFEILKDGVTILSRSTAGMIGGALIGGALSGGAGAIIGGLSGNVTSNEKINSISLKILTRQSHTAHIFYFTDSGIPTTTAMANANSWKDLITFELDKEFSNK